MELQGVESVIYSLHYHRQSPTKLFKKRRKYPILEGQEDQNRPAGPLFAAKKRAVHEKVGLT